MRRRAVFTSILVLVALMCGGPRPSAQRPPNFILIYADDLGYADIGPFSALSRGAPADHAEPGPDGRRGVRLTNFYVAQAVCSASRAALLTGCYPNRVGIRGALGHTADYGINADEATIAEVLKTRGYATAMFGKWHLGHQPPFLPTQHGFDEYLGLPYSNDMWPRHPEKKQFFPDLPLIEGEQVVELDPDQSQLTTLYTERAVRFIERHRDKPFFLYVAHTMPHVPLFVSDKFKGKSGRGLYGDVIAEIDWSVGGSSTRSSAPESTATRWSSSRRTTARGCRTATTPGRRGALREGKGTAFEGGVRVPFVARWPGRIPAGAQAAMPAMTIDLLPTLAGLAGATLSSERIIDGRDIWPVLSGRKNAAAPHDALYFYWGEELHAVRRGKWKLHLPHPYQSLDAAGSDGAARQVRAARASSCRSTISTPIRAKPGTWRRGIPRSSRS